MKIWTTLHRTEVLDVVQRKQAVGITRKDWIRDAVQDVLLGHRCPLDILDIVTDRFIAMAR